MINPTGRAESAIPEIVVLLNTLAYQTLLFVGSDYEPSYGVYRDPTKK